MAHTGFDGTQRGILQRPNPRETSPAYTRDALNLAFVGGRVRSRPGVRPAHGAAFGAPVRGGGTHYRADGSRDYLVMAGADVYRMPLGGDPELLPLTFLPSTEQTRIDPTEGGRLLSLSGADNVTFLFDGVNTNLKWDGVRLTKMGLPTPTAITASVLNAGAAIGAGTRKYFRTLKTPTHESELSAEFSVTQGTSGGQDFTSPVDGVDYDDPQVTKWALYRTQAGVEKRYFVAEADIGLPISDNLTDEVLAAQATAELFVNIPPNDLFIDLVEHKSLVWGVDVSDRNLVRFSYGTSEYIVPEGWPLERVIPVAHGDGDEITRIVSFFEWLVVFKTRSTWAILGDLDTQFQVVPVLAASGGSRLGIGCIGPIIHKENELIFASRDGAYQLERFAGVQAGLAALKISDAIDTLWNCTNFALGNAALYDRQKQTYMLFGYGGD